MDERDLLVASISIGLGATIIYAMLSKAEWLFRLRTPQMLEQNLGRNRAKLVLASIASILILLGAHLIITPRFLETSIDQHETSTLAYPADSLLDLP